MQSTDASRLRRRLQETEANVDASSGSTAASSDFVLVTAGFGESTTDSDATNFATAEAAPVDNAPVGAETTQLATFGGGGTATASSDGSDVAVISSAGGFSGFLAAAESSYEKIGEEEQMTETESTQTVIGGQGGFALALLGPDGGSGNGSFDANSDATVQSSASASAGDTASGSAAENTASGTSMGSASTAEDIPGFALASGGGTSGGSSNVETGSSLRGWLPAALFP